MTDERLMTDDRLGEAIGSLLREIDRPTVDPGAELGQLMAQVRTTPQARRWWQLSFRRHADSGAADPHGDHPGQPPTPMSHSHERQPLPISTEGTRTMFTATKVLVAGIAIALFGGIVASSVLSPDGSDVPAVPGSSSAIDWTTGQVSLRADDFRLEVNDLVFGEDVSPDVVSDPGGSDGWTLEVTWAEHAVEQRVFMYFTANDTEWWVEEIRTYDGHEEGNWVAALGPFFVTPLGETFEGDVTVELLRAGPTASDLVHAGSLSFSGMHLATWPETDQGPGAGDTAAATAAPDVKHVLDAFLETSLDECLDAYDATRILTFALVDIGQTGFDVRMDPTRLDEPSDRQAEIQAHADAGCVFYAGSGLSADGTPIYYLHAE